MHKFDQEFEAFFSTDATKRLLSTCVYSDADLLNALKNEEERLWDIERNQTFKYAIMSNPHLFAGKTVLTLRSGLGLHAIWAAQAGAKRVICVDDSQAMDETKRIVEKMGLDSVIDCLKVKIDGLLLKEKSIDIIIGEWFGFFGMNQGYIYDFIEVRDKFLAKNGFIFPNLLEMHAAGFSDKENIGKKFQFWDNVYSFSMPSMKEICHGEAIFEKVEASQLVTKFDRFQTIDLNTATADDLAFVANFKLTPKKPNSVINGIVLWFDVVFGKAHNEVVLSTSPYENKTDLCNVILMTKKPFSLGQNGYLQGNIAMKNNGDDVNKTQVKLSLKVPKTDQSASQFFIIQ